MHIYLSASLIAAYAIASLSLCQAQQICTDDSCDFGDCYDFREAKVMHPYTGEILEGSEFNQKFKEYNENKLKQERDKKGKNSTEEKKMLLKPPKSLIKRDGIVCICRNGYTGKRCDAYTRSCDTVSCYQGGTCSVVDNTISCRCHSNNVGVFCQESVSCLPMNPCKNDGKCEMIEGKVRCTCPGDRSGILCEYYRKCLKIPCFTKGTVGCIDLNNGFYCVCKPQYKGEFCNETKSCDDPSICLNNGKCLIGTQDKCKCMHGFTGTYCQFRLQCVDNPCGKYITSCKDERNGPSCECDKEYYGDTCSVKVPSVKVKEYQWSVLLLIVTVFLLYNMIRHRKDRVAKYADVFLADEPGAEQNFETADNKEEGEKVRQQNDAMNFEPLKDWLTAEPTVVKKKKKKKKNKKNV